MFATIIKEYRKSVNMSQEEMAYKLGISTNHLSRVERRVVSPSGDLINRIIKTISNDQQFMQLKFDNTELYGLILMLQLYKLKDEDRAFVYKETMRLIANINNCNTIN